MARRSIRILVGILITLALILLAWVVIAGPVTVYRVITRGDTTVYDYRRFPGRTLSPSSHPFRFDVDLQDSAVPASVSMESGEEIMLDELLGSSGTLAFLVIQDEDMLAIKRMLQAHLGE